MAVIARLEGSQSKGTPNALDDLRELCATDFARVNQLIVDHMQSDVPLIPELAGHLVAAGGKRLRPLLTLASARLCGYDGDKHIGLAASAKSASKNIKTHAVHVASAAKNTVTRAEKIVFYGRRVLKAKTAAMAKPWVANIANLAKQLGKGVDANGDKKISWHDGEGGLAVAQKHMVR